MDYILFALIITGTIIATVANFFISKYFSNKNFLNQLKLLENYRKELLGFSITQKQNTEKLIELLNRLFVTSDNQVKPEPNEVSVVNKDEIEFTEQNPINLPNDVKFEVEGGDSFIPPGYQQQSN